MILTENQTKAVRRKKADLQLKNFELANELKVASKTVPKILAGNYNANKRIYSNILEWLASDYLWWQQKKALTPTKVSSLFLQNTKHKLSAGKQDNQGVSNFIYIVYCTIYITQSQATTGVCQYLITGDNNTNGDNENETRK